MEQNFQEVIRDIKKGRYAPVYLLDGEEPYFIDRVLEEIEKIIPEEERDFNLVNFYGKESSWQDIVNAARQFPMFGERILVIVREAAQLRNLDDFLGYIASPQATTVLVIEHRFKKADGKSKFVKAIKKHGVYFNSQELKEQQIPVWIVQFCKDNDSHIEMKDAQLLAAYLGTNLQNIVNELDKIWINKNEGRDITAEKIEKYIGINRTYNVFELFNALFIPGQTERLAHIMNYMIGNPKAIELVKMIGALYSFLEKLYIAKSISPNYTKDAQMGIYSFHRKIADAYSPFQVHQSIAQLERISHKAVGVNSLTKEVDLLKELVGKLQIILGRNNR